MFSSICWKSEEQTITTSMDVQKQLPGVIFKKGVLKNFVKSQENTYTRVSFFNKVAGLMELFCENS